MGGVKLSDKQHFALQIGRRVLNSQLISDGQYLVYSANVLTPFGYVDFSVLTDFEEPSVLWGIDGDWMVNYIPSSIKFNPTDHCGVLRVKSKSFNPHFVKFYLDREGQKVGFSRSYRASLDRISTLSIPSVSIQVQDDIIKEVELLEKRISVLESKLPLLMDKQKNIVFDILGLY